MESHKLSLCSAENNTCVQDQGYCLFNEKIEPICVCLPCFIGKHCEKTVSKNLWPIVTSFDQIVANGETIRSIITIIFGAFLVFNGILCLQTYLCRNIRKTNVGIYLIMLSIVSILIGLLHLIFSSIDLHVEKLRQPVLLLFLDLRCLIYQKYVYIPLVSMYNWFIASVAIERMLVQCSRNYGLHDSRRRSVIASAVVTIICPLTTLPGRYTVHENQPAELRSVHCINFTPLGYVLYQSITHFHLFAFYFIYILMNAIVLGHLLRRRRRFVESGSLFAQVCLILHKHKDFFIPYLIQALGQLPGVIMDLIMTCATANTILAAQLSLISTVLQIAPFAITFYLYIYLSPVYWTEFWNSSPVGKCLVKLKKKLHTVHRDSIVVNDNNLSEHRANIELIQQREDHHLHETRSFLDEKEYK